MYLFTELMNEAWTIERSIAALVRFGTKDSPILTLVCFADVRIGGRITPGVGGGVVVTGILGLCGIILHEKKKTDTLKICTVLGQTSFHHR